MTEIDLGLGVLDHQLVDRDGRRCGNVDDLELDLEHRDGPCVTAILVGPGAWARRGRLGRLLAALTDGSVSRVPWSEVREVRAGVRLAKTAPEYGLGAWDDALKPFVERLPGSQL
jgi:hypothetical protein